ncbi:hypothetical protein SLEP1_g40729 [Rubroshorea leprosula]|uniref:BHLH domain-containing protein n=1 Tax=Rubroshorea leprosula TaxID=152421 RepID=A0AAV5L4B8_9ROSI|nr:hypothetical protein SLEP1_g40729 [Rubroshorea leprosula]
MNPSVHEGVVLERAAAGDRILLIMEINVPTATSARTDRKLIERNRRSLMKSLSSKLNSLIPHLNSLKATSVPDQVDEAVNYIKKLETNLETMKERKDILTRIVSASSSESSGKKFPEIKILEMGSGLVVAVLITGLDGQFIFRETIRTLREEGADILSATSSAVNNGRVFHIIHFTFAKEYSKDGSIPSSDNYESGFTESDPRYNLADLLAMPFFLSLQPSHLQVVDLSYTSIKSLPASSITKLVALQKLILRHCELFMELPPQVGEIQNLEVLDLDGTEILDLPEQTGMLSKLKILRVSFYGYMNSGKRLRQKALINPGTISALSQLTELSIDANPDDERWNEVVETVIEEACSLKTLECLILYLPNVESLGKRRIGSTSLSYYPLPAFRFIIGQHRQRSISRVPKEVEAHFQEWKRCLKFVKGKDIPSEMKKNMQRLELCLLVECNEIQNVISCVESYEEEADMLEDYTINSESGGGSHSAQVAVLPNLQYLHIYSLKNLVSIWRTPTNDKQCLSGLKFLGLHTCPKLRVIFSSVLLANLGKLEVLVVKDCPEVTQVVSLSSNESVDPLGSYLPSLRRVSLLYLPKLVSISSRFQIAPKLEKIGFYNCPKLKGLSKGEMSSGDLKIIKGESKWWEAMKWKKSDQLDHLQSIFCPITREKDVMTQMEEM